MNKLEQAVQSVRPMLKADIDFDTATKTIAIAFGLNVADLRAAVVKQDRATDDSNKLWSDIINAYDSKDLDALLKYAETDLSILSSVIRDNNGAYHKIPKTVRSMKIYLKRHFS